VLVRLSALATCCAGPRQRKELASWQARSIRRPWIRNALSTLSIRRVSHPDLRVAGAGAIIDFKLEPALAPVVAGGRREKPGASKAAPCGREVSTTAPRSRPTTWCSPRNECAGKNVAGVQFGQLRGVIARASGRRLSGRRPARCARCQCCREDLASPNQMNKAWCEKHGVASAARTTTPNRKPTRSAWPTAPGR